MVQNKFLFYKYIATLSLISFLFVGCSQKIQIKAIKSAKVNDSFIKNIGVSSFKNDYISQASQIDSAISNVIIDGKKYFNLIDRKYIYQVISEKKLNDSGLVDLINDNNSEGLSQMEVLLVGEVNLDTVSSSKFVEERTDYTTCKKQYTNKGKTYCIQYRNYNISCKANLYNVKTKIKLIKISNATTIFANTYDETITYKHCLDDKNILPNKKKVNSDLAQKIANRVIKDIAPYYVYFEVSLLDDIDIQLKDKEAKLFDNALTLIRKHKRIRKANEILTKLNNRLKGRSYVTLYNLSITEESLGNLDKAYNLIKKAENIALKKDKIIKEIIIAIKRIENSIEERKKVK
jgi:hypothetical protein